ncbi:MAG: hypothetical protein HRT61_04385 [Ekhidna sp.]|nr:hypothetical protein [Ekhidna sp.]
MKTLTTIGAILVLAIACQPVTDEIPKNPLADFSISYSSAITPLRSNEISKSPWGIHFNGMPFHDMTFAQYDSLDVEALLEELPILIEKTSEMGLKWARVSVDWGLIEDNQGEFHWEILDPTIKGLIDAGIEVYPSLHAGHVMHTNKTPPTSPKELEAWLNFVEKVVSRYQDKVTYWEIWNEPNTTWFWGTPNAAEYTALVKQSSQLIKRIIPEAKVIGGSLARLDVPYADSLFNLGIAEYIDVFSFHPYGVFPEAALKKMKVQVRMPLLYEPVMNTVEGLQQLIAASGKEIELWQGECGYPSAMNGGGWNGTGPYGENTQAKWILRRAFTDLSFDANVSAYFMLKENKHPNYDFYNYKGLLEFHDLRPKAGFKAFQNLASTINGDTKRMEELTCSFEIHDWGGLPGIKSKNLRNAAFQKEDQVLLAYWGVTHMQENTAPGRLDLTIKKSGIENYSSIELINFLTGSIYTPTDVAFSADSFTIQGVPFADYPFMIRIKK